jgi:hypothetical protein
LHSNYIILKLQTLLKNRIDVREDFEANRVCKIDRAMDLNCTVLPTLTVGQIQWIQKKIPPLQQPKDAVSTKVEDSSSLQMKDYWENMVST